MGQYYKIAMKPENGDVIYNDIRVEGCGRMGWKLLEHSYPQCAIVTAVCKKLSETPCRVAWVGDYSEDDEVRETCRGEVDRNELWGEDSKTHAPFAKVKFTSVKKFLLNHDKKLFVSLTGGFFRVTYKWNTVREGKNTTVERTKKLAPLPILTAIGNGRGGWDYYGNDEDLAGTWAWDLLSVSETVPEGYSRLKHLPKKTRKTDSE